MPREVGVCATCAGPVTLRLDGPREARCACGATTIPPVFFENSERLARSPAPAELWVLPAGGEILLSRALSSS